MSHTDEPGGRAELHGVQGGQVGDHNMQINTYGIPVAPPASRKRLFFLATITISAAIVIAALVSRANVATGGNGSGHLSSPGGEMSSLSASSASTTSTGPVPPSSKPSPDPLTVVSEDPLNVDNLGNWVFPRSLVLSSGELKSLNDSKSFTDVADYLYSLGGYQAGETETQLVVQNNRSVPLRVIDVGVIKSCTAPLDGTLFFAPGQASDPGAKIGFDLDSTYPVAVEIPDNSSLPEPSQYYNSAAPYFANYTVSVGPGAQQVFDLFTQVGDHACNFRYQLTILEGEAKVYQIIGDGPEPFRVSGERWIGGRWAGSVMYYEGPCDPDPSKGFVRVNPKTFNFC